MSWAEELYNVYELHENIEHDDSENRLFKIGQATKNAQLEITIDEQGEFIDARALSFEEGKDTLIFVTDKSGAKTSGAAPRPFADEIKYIAGDLKKYTSEDNSKFFEKYIEQLKKWRDSEFNHPSVEALYQYISKSSVIKDLISVNDILKPNEKGMLPDKSKIGGVELDKVFVRFVVQYADLSRKQKTYADDSLYECFAGFNKTLLNKTGLCHITGKTEFITENNPSGIRNSGDMTKLISANDQINFTYLGRFMNKYEAVSVGYESSQKIHNALKWLVQRQGNTYGDTTIIVWSSNLNELPDISASADDLIGDEYNDPPDTMPIYKDYLFNSILLSEDNIPINSKVMIMGLECTKKEREEKKQSNKGRLAITIYSEMKSSVFYDNIIQWHVDTAVRKYSSKYKKWIINSPGVYNIINCAFGYECEEMKIKRKKDGKKQKDRIIQKGELVCKDNIVSDTIHRLIPCITEGKPFPADIMWALYYRASNPLSFKNGSDNDKKGDEQSENKKHINNHRLTLETACGVIKRFYKDHKEYRKGEISMAYDPNECDRSYLYGCLLAIADAAEREAYDEEDKEGRVTNARRYWKEFSMRPYMTWQKIAEQLIPYFNKLGYKKRVRFEIMIREVMDKFDTKNFVDNSALSPLYLLGFNHYTADIFTSKKKEEET